MPRIRHISAVVLFCPLLAGCATYRPEPLDPQGLLDALARRTAGDAAVARVEPGAMRVPPTQPFEPADGLSEAEVVAVALALNPQLQARRLEIGQAQAALITAGVWPNPQVGLNWQAGIDARGSVVDGDLLIELLRLGEREARRAAARAKVAQTKAEVLAAEYELVATVRSQYVALLAAMQAADLLAEEEALRRQVADLIEQQQRIGETSHLDAALARLELTELQRQRRRAEAAVEIARQELNQLLGLPPAYDLRLEEAGRPLVVTLYEDVDDAELDRRLLAGRPDLRAAQAAYEQAEAQLRLAVAEQYPRLVIGPAFGRELEGEWTFGGGLGLELPVLNWNQGGLAEAQAQREQARAAYVAALHALRGRAHLARAQLRLAKAEVEAIEQQLLPVIERNRKLFEGAFRARELSVIEWVTAQQRVLQARRAYLESLAEYRQAAARFEAATGLLLSQPARQNDEG